MPDDPRRYVSRAGLKLEHALDEFGIEVGGLDCADFGCNVGGFTDCLLTRGGRRVYAIDTGYGVLAHALRVDPRVVVMERTNALHAPPPDPAVDLVTIDMAWTPQRHAIPAALKWLSPRGTIITLVKPHYELTESEKRTRLEEGVLPPEDAPDIVRRVLESMTALGVESLGSTRSPLTGGKSARKRRGRGGNVEYLAWLRPLGTP